MLRNECQRLNRDEKASQVGIFSVAARLMHGQALTATELARCAHITPQTASTTLSRLTQAGLLSVQKQGRHRYHKIASAEVARMIEAVIGVAADQAGSVKRVVTGPRDEAMRKARTCYDHFAGRLGVGITDGLIKKKYLIFNEEAGVISKAGIKHLAGFGIELNIDQSKKKIKTTYLQALSGLERTPPACCGCGGGCYMRVLF